MPPRIIDHLIDLGLSDLKCIYAAYAHSATVDVQHYLSGILTAFREETLQHVNDELHRRVIIVQHQHFVQCRLLGLRAGLDDNTGTRPAIVIGFARAAHVRRMIIRQALPLPPMIFDSGRRQKPSRTALTLIASNKINAGGNIWKGNGRTVSFSSADRPRKTKGPRRSRGPPYDRDRSRIEFTQPPV